MFFLYYTKVFFVFLIYFNHNCIQEPFIQFWKILNNSILPPPEGCGGGGGLLWGGDVCMYVGFQWFH